MPAPTLKQKYAVSVDAKTLLVTDLTGAYNVTTNPTGWGAPKWEKAQSALWVVVKRKASVGDEYFVAITNEITFNPSALNTEETALDFGFSNDGVLEITMGALRASLDGINYINLDPIVTGDYFYWASGGNKVWQKIAGVNTALASVHLLASVVAASVPLILATDILEPRLAIVKQGLYKKYRLARDVEEDDAEPLFQEGLKLSEDIKGSIYAFYSGLTVEAQSQVETMLDRYEIASQ